MKKIVLVTVLASAFAAAVDRFLQREGAGIDDYLGELERRNHYKSRIDI